MRWIAFNASPYRLPQSFFDQVDNYVTNIFYPWFDVQGDIEYIVEGTFFVRDTDIKEALLELFKTYSVKELYCIDEADLNKLNNLKKEEIYQFQRATVVTKDDMVCVRERSSPYFGVRAQVLRVYGLKALLFFELRSVYTFGVVEVFYLEKQENP